MILCKYPGALIMEWSIKLILICYVLETSVIIKYLSPQNLFFKFESFWILISSICIRVGTFTASIEKGDVNKAKSFLKYFKFWILFFNSVFKYNFFWIFFVWIWLIITFLYVMHVGKCIYLNFMIVFHRYNLHLKALTWLLMAVIILFFLLILNLSNLISALLYVDHEG